MSSLRIPDFQSGSINKKVKVVTPVEPIPVEAIKSIDSCCEYLEGLKDCIEFRLTQNKREQAILERCLFRLQLTLIDLSTVKGMARETNSV